MNFLKNEKGAAMPLVLIIMVVLLLLGTALWFYSMNDLRQVAHAENKVRAYYVARAGAESLARHIKLNPAIIEDILKDDEENFSELITLETEYLGTAGEMKVTLKKLDSEKYEIIGTGITNGVQQSVSIILQVTPFPGDAVVITTGSQLVDFHQNMTVNGSVVAGGNINLPNNYDLDEYNAIPNFSFPEDYFKRVVVPDDPDEYWASRSLGTGPPSGRTLTIPAGKHYEIGNLSMNIQGKIIFETHEDAPTILVVDNLNIISGGTLEIVGDGSVDIYIRQTANMLTPNIIQPPNAQLNFFLAEGAEMTLNGNVTFDGLLYGPYNTHVKMQSNGTFNGAMIVETLSGMGGNNHIGAAGTLFDFYRGFGDMGIQPVVNMLYWSP